MSRARKLYIGTSNTEQAIEQQISIKELKISADRAALEILFQRYADELEEIGMLRLELCKWKIVH